MNRKSLTIAATTVTAVSSAVLVAKKVKNNKKDEKVNTYRNTELGKYEKMIKEFIIQMEIMKLLPDLKNQKMLKIKMHI